MMNRKWFWKGLILTNLLLLVVVVADWRSQEVAQMGAALKNQGSAKVATVKLLKFDAENQTVLADPQLLKDVVSTVADHDPTDLETVEAVIDANSDARLADEKEPSVCLIFGPFDATQRSQVLAKTVPTLTLQWLEISVPRGSEFSNGSVLEGYRVFVPPRETLEAAYELLKVFRAQGFDSYVMTQGGYAKGISLGVFSSELAAQNLLGQLGPGLRSYARVGAASPERLNFMLRVETMTDEDVGALRRIFPEEIDPVGRICGGSSGSEVKSPN